MNVERTNSFQQTAKYFKMKYAGEWAEVQRKLQEGKTVAELLTPEQVGAQNDSKALPSINEPAQGEQPPNAWRIEPPPAGAEGEAKE